MRWTRGRGNPEGRQRVVSRHDSACGHRGRRGVAVPPLGAIHAQPPPIGACLTRSSPRIAFKHRSPDALRFRSISPFCLIVATCTRSPSVPACVTLGFMLSLACISPSVLATPPPPPPSPLSVCYCRTRSHRKIPRRTSQYCIIICKVVFAPFSHRHTRIASRPIIRLTFPLYSHDS